MNVGIVEHYTQFHLYTARTIILDEKTSMGNTLRVSENKLKTFMIFLGFVEEKK